METRELDFFKKTIQNSLHKVEAGRVVLTDFLDETEQAIFKQIVKKSVNMTTAGGFKDAERKRILLQPVNSNIVDYRIKVYEINYNAKYLTVTHRKVLGCLMSLGIERKSVGDIYIHDDKAYFACTEEISPFVSLNFNEISGIPIKIKECQEEIKIEKKFIYKNVNVASLRLDVIVAMAYHLSRKEALEMINAGLIFVNHQIQLNNSFIVKENDIVSVRHKGRVYIDQIGSKTKSDRINVKLGFLVL